VILCAEENVPTVANLILKNVNLANGDRPEKALSASGTACDMYCVKPYVNQQGKAYGCGQCFPCKLNRRRIWTHRLMLESLHHEQSAFLTLTYSDKFLPLSAGGLPTLSVSDFTLFMKRLRKKVGHPIRFFGVGEYGDTTQRPHYHAVLFGLPTCAYGRTRMHKEKCCSVCSLVSSAWTVNGEIVGGIELGEVNTESMQYVCGYTVKKMTSLRDTRLNGRQPEFSRQSRRPGIGSTAVETLATALTLHPSSALRHGRKVMPLGAYMKKKLKDRGVIFPDADEDAQVLAVRKAAGFVEISPDQFASAWAKYGVPSAPMAKAVIGGHRSKMAQAMSEESKGKEASLKARFKLKGKPL